MVKYWGLLPRLMIHILWSHIQPLVWHSSTREFFASSRSTFNTFLADFIDHDLVHKHRGPHGREYLYTRLPEAVLKQILNKHEAWHKKCTSKSLSVCYHFWNEWTKFIKQFPYVTFYLRRWSYPGLIFYLIPRQILCGLCVFFFCCYLLQRFFEIFDDLLILFRWIKQNGEPKNKLRIKRGDRPISERESP